jgi:GT2 family glycosyltransferase
VTVSVVIPMYNARSWIGEALDSVFRQTHPAMDIELLVVDDGSSDGSAAVARSFLRDRSMKGEIIALERNAGVGAARNTGWKRATGEWVQFLDADDLLAPGKIERQAAVAAGLPDDVAVVYSKWQRIGLRDGRWLPIGPLMGSSVDDNTVLRILGDADFGYVGPTLIRRSFLRLVAGFDEQLRLGEDLDLMLRLAMAGGRFREVPSPEPLFFYRQTPGSLWQRSFRSGESVASLVRGFRRVETFLRDRSPDGLGEDARRALAWRYARHLSVLFEHDRAAFRESLEWIRGLGLTYPPGTSRKWRLVSRLIGYESAQALQLSGRRVGRWLRRARGA